MPQALGAAIVLAAASVGVTVTTATGVWLAGVVISIGLSSGVTIGPDGSFFGPVDRVGSPSRDDEA